MPSVEYDYGEYSIKITAETPEELRKAVIEYDKADKEMEELR